MLPIPVAHQAPAAPSNAPSKYTLRNPSDDFKDTPLSHVALQYQHRPKNHFIQGRNLSVRSHIARISDNVPSSSHTQADTPQATAHSSPTLADSEGIMRSQERNTITHAACPNDPLTAAENHFTTRDHLLSQTVGIPLTFETPSNVSRTYSGTCTCTEHDYAPHLIPCPARK